MVVRVAAVFAIGAALCTCISAADAAPPFRIGYVVQIGAYPETQDLSGLMYEGFINAAHEPGVTGRVMEIGLSTVTQGVYLAAPVATRHPKTLFLVPDAQGVPGPKLPRNLLVTVFRPRRPRISPTTSPRSRPTAARRPTPSAPWTVSRSLRSRH